MPSKIITVNGKSISLGDMRTRVTFQVASRVQDEIGGFTETWNNISPNPQMWGYLAATSSRERLFSQQMQYQRSHVLATRYRSDLTTDMRMTYEGRTFQIKGFKNPEERNYFLIIDLEENQGK